MELFDSEEKLSPEEAQELEPTGSSKIITEEVKPAVAARRTQRGETWLSGIIVILVGIVLVVLLVFFARWVYHRTHHNSQSTPVTTQNQSSSKTNSSSQRHAASGNNQSSNFSDNSNGSVATRNSQLPNSGPGNTVAIFAGASIAATGLHYIIRLRRFN